MRNIIYILLFFFCNPCLGCSACIESSRGNDSVTVVVDDNQDEDSIFMELSVTKFKMPVDTIISAKIVNKTTCSLVELKGGKIIEKKINGKWMPFKHREKTKSGAAFAVTLLAVNIGKRKYYKIDIPLRSEYYVKDFTLGEYRLGKEIVINRKEIRYIYSTFWVY